MHSAWVRMQNTVVEFVIQEVLTRLEVREGSDFPRFWEHKRTRLEISDDGEHAVDACWGLVCSRRYFPAEKQNKHEFEMKTNIDK